MSFTRRTQDEIVERVNKIKVDDVFDTFADLIVCLDFEHAKPFLKDDVDPAKWEQDYTKESIIKDMKDYMKFAWGKAIDERGLSANRSIQHFQHWLFLLHDDEMFKFAEDGNNYPMYGKPILKKICQEYGFEIPEGE